MRIIATSEGLENPLKVVPIVGSLAGAAISSGVTYYVLNSALDAHTEIAQKTIVVVNELSIEKGMSQAE